MAGSTEPTGGSNRPAVPDHDRRVLHADMDAFYASVERRDNPSLGGVPVIVGQEVVLAATYDARAKGVRTAMNSGRAAYLCPEAVVVPPRMNAYAEASEQVFSVFADTTPLVEGLSIDEAFLDVSGLNRSEGTPVGIATRLRERIRTEVGLPLSIGVASTKFLAKVASAAAKPNGLLAIPLGGELEFLWPLPVRCIWGVGPATEERLRSRGVHTVGELAAIPETTLRSWLGRAGGTQLHALAHNHDPRPVEVNRRRKSVGAQQALGRRAIARSEAEVLLVQLVERVVRRLRDGQRTARTVEVRWRGHDMGSHTMSATLDHPTNDTATLLDSARRLLDAAWPTIAGAGLGLLGFSVTNLSERQAVQLGFDFTGRDRTELDSTLDAVQARFGDGAITRGSLLGRSYTHAPLPADPVPDD